MRMDITTLTLHIVNLLAPALVVGGIVSVFRLGARVHRPILGLLGRMMVNVLVGCAVLVLGLVMGSEDGKMITYAGLIVAVAFSQWVLMRGWQA
jgi:hypothetical protein